MKNYLFVFLLFMPGLYCFASAWECVSDSDCSEAMSCNQGTCRMVSGKFSDYAQVEIKIGDNTPTGGGSRDIIVPHPAENIVLGQFEIHANQPGSEGKFFLFRGVEVRAGSSSPNIKFSNIKLVHDKNGNGIFDSSDVVVASVDDPEKSTLNLALDQKHATYKMNVGNSFIVVGDVEFEGSIDNLYPFGLEIAPSDLLISNTGDVFITSGNRLIFTKYIFEPQKGYFIFTSGGNFPVVPEDWRDMNKLQEVMHIRARSVDGANEIKNISLRTVGSSAKFGEGVRSVFLYLDENGNGKGDRLIAEQSFTSENPTAFAMFNISGENLNFDEGEEKHFVIKADIDLYSGQTLQFNIGAGDVALGRSLNIAGTPLNTGNYRYVCDENDPECNVLEEEVVEPEPESGGCTVVIL